MVPSKASTTGGRAVEELERELAEANRRAAATAEVLRVIRSSPTDVQPVFDTIVRSAVRLCDGLFGAVVRFDGELMHLAAYHNYTSEVLQTLQQMLPMRPDSRLVAGRAILTREMVHVEDAQADPEFAQRVARTGGFRSMLAVPMLREGNPIGAIVVNREQPGPFSATRIELLKTFADQAVIAIENTRLFDAEQASKRELQESLEYQTATSEVLSVISRSPTDVQPVFDAIAQSAARLCEAEFCHVFRFDGKLIHFAAVHGLTPEGREALRSLYPMPPGRVTAAARSILTRAVEEIPDVRADSDYSVPHSLVIGFRSVAAVPMLKDGRPIGTIAVMRSQTGRFPARHIQLLQTFADQAVIAIENTRLFEAEQASKRELQESLEYQTATSNVLDAISRSPSQLQPVVDAIVQTATRLCSAERATMWSWREGKFDLIAHTIVDPALAKYLKDNPIPPDHTSLATRAVLERRTMHVPDLQAEPELGRKYQVVLGKIRTLLAVPLLRKGEPIGVLSLSKSEVDPFSQRQIALVETFADQAVIAIENTRLFEAEQASKRELQESLDYQTATADV